MGTVKSVKDINQVEQIVDRRINPATQAFEYLVRFKGYSECDDLWLAASSFNMPLNYVSVSSFGRKRKWRTNIDESTSEHCSESPKRVGLNRIHKRYISGRLSDIPLSL